MHPQTRHSLNLAALLVLGSALMACGPSAEARASAARAAYRTACGAQNGRVVDMDGGTSECFPTSIFDPSHRLYVTPEEKRSEPAH